MGSGESDVRPSVVNPTSTAGMYFDKLNLINTTGTASNNNVVLTNTVSQWTSPKYYYQVQCPSCNMMWWAELNQTFTCKCEAKIKLVLEDIDHYITVKPVTNTDLLTGY
jgi:hypothetical protein